MKHLFVLIHCTCFSEQLVCMRGCRAAVAEQAKSLGAEFLTVELEESGEGSGGYAEVHL